MRKVIGSAAYFGLEISYHDGQNVLPRADGAGGGFVPAFDGSKDFVDASA
jgi:hypothetical protein